MKSGKLGHSTNGYIYGHKMVALGPRLLSSQKTYSPWRYFRKTWQVHDKSDQRHCSFVFIHLEASWEPKLSPTQLCVPRASTGCGTEQVPSSQCLFTHRRQTGWGAFPFPSNLAYTIALLALNLPSLLWCWGQNTASYIPYTPLARRLADLCGPVGDWRQENGEGTAYQLSAQHPLGIRR